MLFRSVSAWLYFSPYDIYAWYRNFGRIFENPAERQAKESGLDNYNQNRANAVELSNESLAWAIADIPANDLGYIRKDLMYHCDSWKWILKNRGINVTSACPSVIGAFNALSAKNDKLFDNFKRTVIFDISRQCQALTLIDEMYANWGKKDFWRTLPSRIMYGIPEEMIDLVRIPGIGGVRARKLWSRGFKTLEDLIDLDKKRDLMTIFKGPMIRSIQIEVKKLLDERKEK